LEKSAPQSELPRLSAKIRRSRELLAKLEGLPVVDGRPDFSGIGDPAEVAKQWAAEMKIGQAETFDRLAKHLEAIGDLSGPNTSTPNPARVGKSPASA
jgi:hypothetical protein